MRSFVCQGGKGGLRESKIFWHALANFRRDVKSKAQSPHTQDGTNRALRWNVRHHRSTGPPLRVWAHALRVRAPTLRVRAPRSKSKGPHSKSKDPHSKSMGPHSKSMGPHATSGSSKQCKTCVDLATSIHSRVGSCFFLAATLYAWHDSRKTQHVNERQAVNESRHGNEQNISSPPPPVES